MPELAVLVFQYLCVCLFVFTQQHFPWRLLFFAMGITVKQEVMQHCSMVLCLKWNFGQIKEAFQAMSSMLLRLREISGSTNTTFRTGGAH